MITLLVITYIIVSIGAIITTIILINRHQKRKYQAIITNLERDKNLIVSASILSELKKVDNLINNDSLKQVQENFQHRFSQIKEVDLPDITDKLIEIENLYDQKKFKELEPILAKVELNIYYIRKKAKYLLDEIKEVTLSEEKNRERVTKLKTMYREVYTKYHRNKSDYELIEKSISLQFENIDKLFASFENMMEQNKINEVGKIVKALDDTIGNLKMVIEEAPTIILMGKHSIPKKIEDVKGIYNRLTKSGFNLDYLNIEHNISEAEKKIADVFDRLNVLNLEDSIFDLRTINDYFDSLYNDFDKEKLSKKIFEDYSRSIILKIRKYQKIINGIWKSIDEIKYSYDLKDEDVVIVNVIDNELTTINSDYDAIMESYHNKSFAYSRLSQEFEGLNARLLTTEEKVINLVNTIGSFKEDEKRAHEQLFEIKDILKKSKDKMKEYKLPVIPSDYYVQLSETTEAINEVIKELNMQPISIKILNTRVDTARDLVLKFYITSKEIIKTARMAETAIVYGNRYRAINREVDFGISKAEIAFYKGNFKNSLECSIKAINIVEPGIHKKLLAPYQN